MFALKLLNVTLYVDCFPWSVVGNFVIHYSGVRYNELRYNELRYNELCYNERKLQRKFFSIKS